MVFTLGTFVFFTALVAVISWYLTKDDDLKTESGYFLGGRSLSATVIAGSMMLTNLSTEQMVGINAQGFKSGLAVIALESGASIGIVILAIYFLPKYLQGSITTVPEFLEERYDKSVRNIVSIFFLLTLGIAFLPTVLYSGSIAMMKLFDIPGIFGISQESAIVLSIWLIGIIGSIYAIFGGLKAVAVSDTVNGVGLVIGGLAIPVLGFIYLGDGSMLKGMEYIFQHAPEKLNTIGGKDSQAPFGAAITGMRITALYYWCTNQAIIQRALGAKSLKEGQKGVLLTALLKIVVAPFISKSSGGLFEFIQKVAGLFSVPIAIIVLVGIFSRKASALAAKISMGFFVIVYGYTQFIGSFKLHFLYVVAILFVICLIIIYVVDKIIPPKKEYSLPVRYEVPIEPWEYRYTVSVILMALLVYIYVIFSKLGILYGGEFIKMRTSIITLIFIVITGLICTWTRKIEKNSK